MLVAACGSTPPSSNPIPPPPTSSASLPAATSTVAAFAVAPDPALLDLVPAAAAGSSLVYDSDTTASVAADPKLGQDATALATGLARVVGAAPDAPDFAIVNVVRLRDPSADEAWFRQWRDTYDLAACAQAGGVTRHAQTGVDQLTVFVGVCKNDAFTYHVRLQNDAVVLSITSIGPADLGRQIVEKLHP